MAPWLTRDEVMSTPAADLPLIVLSLDYQSLISAAISRRTAGHYSHFMWMHRPGFFASQGWAFKEAVAEKYLDHHRLKFWTCPKWTDADRAAIRSAIAADLARPKLSTRYDWLAIVGQALGLLWLQNPVTRICSDYAGYLRDIDPAYDLRHPSPTAVNRWLTARGIYQVYGRYCPD